MPAMNSPKCSLSGIEIMKPYPPGIRAFFGGAEIQPHESYLKKNKTLIFTIEAEFKCLFGKDEFDILWVGFFGFFFFGIGM